MTRKQIETLMQQFTAKGKGVTKLPPGCASGLEKEYCKSKKETGKSATRLMYYGLE